ncbi:hypothetical protein AKO1_010907 [Acrasis kona]|uniref:Uncharacterized protein n=1 Tax=Acrasis kona TaxID=1008807 RepID=A0AAW2YUZ1_9EUKA
MGIQKIIFGYFEAIAVNVMTGAWALVSPMTLASVLAPPALSHELKNSPVMISASMRLFGMTFVLLGLAEYWIFMKKSRLMKPMMISMWLFDFVHIGWVAWLYSHGGATWQVIANLVPTTFLNLSRLYCIWTNQTAYERRGMNGQKKLSQDH